MDWIVDVINTIPNWVHHVTLLITAMAGIATLTPTKTDDRALSMVLRVVNMVGLNFGKARNADD
jgi:hypothetical protein